MQYTLTELIQNDEFIAWVLHPNAGRDSRWQAYAAESPEKERTVTSARKYVRLLAEDTGRHKPTPEQSDQMWRVVKRNMVDEVHPGIQNADPAHHGFPVRATGRTRKFLFRKKWQLAACVAVAFAFSTAAYQYYRTEKTSTPVSSIDPVGAQPETLAKHNTTRKPMTVLLPDGSSVVLLPGGRIEYLSLNLPDNRSVALSGKAFFEIVRDQDRPFYVFTDGIATKVLGTSFLVDAPADTDEVKVEVKTGRVSVFRANKEHAFQPNNILEGKTTILNPNQRSAFSRSNGQLIKALEMTLPLEDAKIDEVVSQSFAFDETPISEVFGALERSYNVAIHFDGALMKDCTINATLAGEPFVKKLSVICAALGTEYTIRDEVVFITGKACR